MKGWLALLATLALTAVPRSALAHDWYPYECCSDGDCHLADAVLREEAGRLVALVGTARVLLPADLPARLSPDGRVHVCYEDGDLGIRVRCLFLPPEG